MKTTYLFPLVAAALAVPPQARAHCDTLDGPVVVAARTALDTGKIEPVLAWVRPGDEPEIRAAFSSAREVRKGGKAPRELADRWFFETVVRVHRAGEGAPFTGLRPAGTPDPAVAATDRLVATGDPEPLEELLVRSVKEGLHARLERLREEKPPAGDVVAGRRWVAAYVPFIHWAEAVQAAAAGAEHGAVHAAGHGHETEGAEADARSGREPPRPHAH